MIALAQTFTETERRHRVEADRRRRQDVLRNRQQQEKREENEDRAEEAVTAFAQAVVVSTPAPPERIAEFEVTLTAYDIAVVKALMANDERMAALQSDISAMLSQAFTLDDGRRVFKTEDGTQVFDEHGEEVPADIFDPDAIPDDTPTWEVFSELKEIEEALTAERESILEYQAKLDDARSEIADGEIPVEELDALEADLADSMPPAVAVYVEGNTGPEVVLEAKPETFAEPAIGTAITQTNGLINITPG